MKRSIPVLLKKIDQQANELNEIKELLKSQKEALDFLLARAKGEDVQAAKTILTLVKK